MTWRTRVAAISLVLSGALSTLPQAEADAMSRRLAACPSTPNCVSSDAAEASQRVAPFVSALPHGETWRRVREAVAAMPRTEVKEFTDTYLHAECRSLVFRFVDDLELEWRPEEGIIAVRSASRIGRHDFGVNRRRVERLRSELQSRGAIPR